MTLYPMGKARSLDTGAGPVSRPTTGFNAGSIPAPGDLLRINHVSTLKQHIFILLCFSAISLTGCSEEDPARHVSKCQVEWYSASERVQDEWGSQFGFLKECMSAEDFEFDNPVGSRCAAL